MMRKIQRGISLFVRASDGIFLIGLFDNRKIRQKTHAAASYAHFKVGLFFAGLFRPFGWRAGLLRSSRFLCRFFGACRRGILFLRIPS